MKYDLSGSLLWAVQSGTPRDDYGYGVAVSNVDGVFVSGVTGPSSAFGLTVFLKFASSDGAVLGTTSDGDYSSRSEANGVAVASSQVYITGVTTASMNGQINVGSRDTFLVHYSILTDSPTVAPTSFPSILTDSLTVAPTSFPTSKASSKAKKRKGSKKNMAIGLGVGIVGAVMIGLGVAAYVANTKGVAKVEV